MMLVWVMRPMQFRFGIATVLYLAAALSIGCACGSAARQDRTLGLLGPETGREKANGHLTRAAVFREYGRYYK